MFSHFLLSCKPMTLVVITLIDAIGCNSPCWAASLARDPILCSRESRTGDLPMLPSMVDCVTGIFDFNDCSSSGERRTPFHLDDLPVLPGDYVGGEEVLGWCDWRFTL